MFLHLSLENKETTSEKYIFLKKITIISTPRYFNI